MADIDAKKIEAGSMWRHKNRLSVYRVIDGFAQVQAPEGSGLTDYEVVVVYQSKDGETWVRRHSEFLDGRFEKLSEPPSKEWLTRMAAAEDGHEVGAGASLPLAGDVDYASLLHDLDGYGSCGDFLMEVPLVSAMRATCEKAADAIRSLAGRVEGLQSI